MASSEAEGTRHAEGVRRDGRGDRELVRRETEPGGGGATHEGGGEREEDLGTERGIPRVRLDLPGPAVGLADVGGCELRVPTAPLAGRDDRADENARRSRQAADRDREAHLRPLNRGREGHRSRRCPREVEARERRLDAGLVGARHLPGGGDGCVRRLIAADLGDERRVRLRCLQRLTGEGDACDSRSHGRPPRGTACLLGIEPDTRLPIGGTRLETGHERAAVLIRRFAQQPHVAHDPLCNLLCRGEKEGLPALRQCRSDVGAPLLTTPRIGPRNELDTPLVGDVRAKQQAPVVVLLREAERRNRTAISGRESPAGRGDRPRFELVSRSSGLHGGCGLRERNPSPTEHDQKHDRCMSTH